MNRNPKVHSLNSCQQAIHSLISSSAASAGSVPAHARVWSDAVNDSSPYRPLGETDFRANIIRTHFGHRNVSFSTRRYNNAKTPSQQHQQPRLTAKPLSRLEGGLEKAGGGSIPSLATTKSLACGRLSPLFIPIGTKGFASFDAQAKPHRRWDALREAIAASRCQAGLALG